MNDLLRRRMAMGQMPADIIINREWSDNDAALMEVMYSRGYSKSPNYMRKKEAETISSIDLNSDDTTIAQRITDLSVLQHFTSLTKIIRLTLPKLQKVIIPNSMKFAIFNYNWGFGGLSTNPITLVDANWLMTFREYCGIDIPSEGFGTTKYTKNIVLNGIKVAGDIVIPKTYISKNSNETPITKVGANFANCIDITSVTLPSTCKTLGFDAFRNCTNLSRIELNEGLVTIDKNSIRYTAITELVIPNSVTTILGSYGNYAISNNNSLKKVVLSNSITDTQYGNFSECQNIEEFDFNNTTALITIGRDFLVKNKKLTSIILPNSVTTIDYGFCRMATGLTYVELGENVSSIGAAFLYQSDSKKTLVLRAVTPPTASSDYFLVSSGVNAIYVPDGSVQQYKSADVWSTFADRIKPLSEYTE